MTDPINVTTAILRELRDMHADLGAQLGDVNRRLDTLDAAVVRHEGRFDTIEALLVGHVGRFDTIETAVSALSAQVRMVSAGVTASLNSRERAAVQAELLGNRVDKLEDRVDVLEARED
ncbi:hypothetical protein [Enhygromyxa salina]|uniref:Uncharacterized protein n=1 Tax=Enhygromyxa salina TaxID=215803 RepID=A0A2S9Y642_9BACT|nr:hypothetical protein [Enhygromyxa salina]PRQ00573.1 hypothetical protein ENSA7_60670 [Enhygromyxa salina]